MTGVENKFAELKKADKKGLIIYITAGIPDADSTVQLVLEAEKARPLHRGQELSVVPLEKKFHFFGPEGNRIM